MGSDSCLLMGYHNKVSCDSFLLINRIKNNFINALHNYQFLGRLFEIRQINLNFKAESKPTISKSYNKGPIPTSWQIFYWSYQ